MAYIKTIFASVLILCCCITGICQQGGSGRAANDTLIRNKNSQSKGLKPIVNLNTYYRLHVGLAYNIVSNDSTNEHRKNRQTIGLNYSITEKSFHPYYRASFPQLFAGWNLSLSAGYDGVRRVNYYGVGNETVRHLTNEKYNWLRTENQYGSLGVDKTFRNRNNIGLSFLYDGIRVMDDAGRLSSKQNGEIDSIGYTRQTFLGSRLSYSYISLNEPNIPTKGIEFTTSAAYTESMQRNSHSFARLTTDLDIYLPLFNQFSFVFRTGFATVSGNPDFYQLNTLGGTRTMRGFEQFRFYGKTSFYNQNELRWISFVENKFYTGNFGVFALFDQGRVWHPGETSNKMHNGYGGGLILSLFKKAVVTAAYAVSKDDKRIHMGVRRIL